MKLFKCSHCGQLIYFENTHCEKCGLRLGFETESLELFALKEENNDLFRIQNKKSNQRYRYCSNYQYNVCNWLIPENNTSGFCRACELNRTIPDLSNSEYMQEWKTIETAKHRLVYSLLRMKLPLVSKTENEETGLAFDFVADTNLPKAEKILSVCPARAVDISAKGTDKGSVSRIVTGCMNDSNWAARIRYMKTKESRNARRNELYARCSSFDWP